jgi:hypothetical protein
MRPFVVLFRWPSSPVTLALRKAPEDDNVDIAPIEQPEAEDELSHLVVGVCRGKTRGRSAPPKERRQSQRLS